MELADSGAKREEQAGVGGAGEARARARGLGREERTPEKVGRQRHHAGIVAVASPVCHPEARAEQSCLVTSTGSRSTRVGVRGQGSIAYS